MKFYVHMITYHEEAPIYDAVAYLTPEEAMANPPQWAPENMVAELEKAEWNLFTEHDDRPDDIVAERWCGSKDYPATDKYEAFYFAYIAEFEVHGI